MIVVHTTDSVELSIRINICCVLEDGQIVKGSKLPEKPISFNKMEDVKRTWESSSGSQKTKEELRAEHKKEISQIRSRLFQVSL